MRMVNRQKAKKPYDRTLGDYFIRTATSQIEKSPATKKTRVVPYALSSESLTRPRRQIVELKSLADLLRQRECDQRLVISRSSAGGDDGHILLAIFALEGDRIRCRGIIQLDGP